MKLINYYYFIFALLIFNISCTNKIIKVDDETKKICQEKKYNGSYKLNLIRECTKGTAALWGEVNLEINQCVLSVNDLYGAVLIHEPDRLENWKTLSGVVDSKGRISGTVFLRILSGNADESRKLVFYGSIIEKKMIAKISNCKFKFNLTKIQNSLENEVLQKVLSTEKSSTIIVPTGILGKINENQKIILEKTLESKIDDHFAIVSKDLFEQAQEKAFEELDYDECTEEQCIVKIQELLQVENAFRLLLVRDGNDTQISLTWNTLDQKRVEEVYCENCNTKKLRETIEGIVEKLVSNQ